MACPPVSTPSCREDQFLVEVRGEKTCCYSYLCGEFLIGRHRRVWNWNQKFLVWGWPSAMSLFFTPPSITATKLNLLLVFSVWAVCESCIEPIPTCSHGEILAVDLNTTNSCCPQYHCGKYGKILCESMCMCVTVSVSLELCLNLLPCVAVCDVNLCPESSVSCAPGLSLIQTTVPGHCCPQHHCGTHSKAYSFTHTGPGQTGY